MKKRKKENRHTSVPTFTPRKYSVLAHRMMKANREAKNKNEMQLYFSVGWVCTNQPITRFSTPVDQHLAADWPPSTATPVRILEDRME